MLRAYAATLAVFLAVDAVWLRLVVLPLFEADVPQLLAASPNYLAAALFYAGYAAGIVWFAVRPSLSAGGSIGAALRDGALLGAVAYLTYEGTNMATLEGWTWRLVWIDTAWGAALTSAAAAVGCAVARRRIERRAGTTDPAAR